MVTGTQPFGVLYEPLNPIALAVAMDASFVARGFSGDQDQLRELMRSALEHKGFAILDIMQPCVSYNKINTFQWYRDRCYPIEPEYDPADRVAAFQRSLEFGEKIPTGIIYRSERQTLEERIPVIANREPLVQQPFSPEDVAGELTRFF